jgi:hypothetical protein
MRSARPISESVTKMKYAGSFLVSDSERIPRGRRLRNNHLLQRYLQRERPGDLE